jgi:hypothetical protein
MERSLPTFAEGWNAEGPFYLLARVPWQIQQGIHLRDCDLFRTIRDSYDVIARTDFSLLQHTKVKSWSPVRDEQGRYARLIHADADAVAGHTRLRYLEYRTSNPIVITDTDFVVRKSLNREVLSKLAKSEVITPKKALPVIIGIQLINEYGTLFASVACKIGLGIPIDIQLAHLPSPLHRKLPDRCSHRLALPLHFAWQTGVQREQSGHFLPPPRRGIKAANQARE